MRRASPGEAKSKDASLQPSHRRRSACGPPKGWVGFEVGEDFTQNKELMKFLAERTKNAKKARSCSLEEVKAELGIR